MAEKSLINLPGFKVKMAEEKNENIACLHFGGDCFLPDFLDHMSELSSEILGLKKKFILLNFTELEHINSRFISFLLDILDPEIKYCIIEPSTFLKDLLEMVGIIDNFEIFKSVDSFFNKYLPE